MCQAPVEVSMTQLLYGALATPVEIVITKLLLSAVTVFYIFPDHFSLLVEFSMNIPNLTPASHLLQQGSAMTNHLLNQGGFNQGFSRLNRQPSIGSNRLPQHQQQQQQPQHGFIGQQQQPMMLGGLPPMSSAPSSGGSSPSLNNGHPYSMMSFLHQNGGGGNNGLGNNGLGNNGLGNNGLMHNGMSR